MASAKLDTALRELLQEEHRLERLQHDYAIVTRSRFYGLRVFCEALTQMFSGRMLALDALDSEHYPEARLVVSWRDRVHARPLSATPIVTIVIPEYNHRYLTVQCLQSIAASWFDTLQVQIVVVDDGSTEDVADLAARLPGLDYVRNERNEGFSAACNAGARRARGKYLCFLNNDTVVHNGWLDWLVTTAEQDPGIGAVGSKLVFPDGRLQEAGSIVFSDGSAWNYGGGDDAGDPRYDYPRDVDYCSAASLLVRTDLFARLGGFKAAYTRAYYEDVDLCFGVRALGYRVVYEPRSHVIHEGSVTFGASSDDLQNLNRATFREIWSSDLGRHLENAPASIPQAARRLRRGETILVVDSYVPLYDKEAGSSRLFTIVQLLRGLGYHVIFCPDNYAGIQPYTAELQGLGVEVLYQVKHGRSAEDALNEVLPLLDFAWICRPELFAKYRGLIERNRNTRFIYDTIELHFVSRRRRDALFAPVDGDEQSDIEALELSAAASAHATVTVTQDERRLLERSGIRNVHVIPTFHEPREIPTPGFGERSGVLFIGGYGHPPNVDAARCLCNEIMPIVWQRLPGAVLTLLGNDPNNAIRALASERVHVPGYQPDVDAYFESHRVFAAPLRFGAGHRGKIGHALRFGLPVVTTPIGAEGYGLSNGIDVLLASSPDACAEAILRLSSDAALWEAMSAASRRSVLPFSRTAIAPRLADIFVSLPAIT